MGLHMTRFLLTCMFYTTIARWGYSEIALMFPSAMPLVNKVVNAVQIPTHNKWSSEKVQGYVDEAEYALKDAGASIDDIKEMVNNLKDVSHG